MRSSAGDELRPAVEDEAAQCRGSPAGRSVDGPARADDAFGTGISERDLDDAAEGLRGLGEQGNPEPGGDETADRLNVLALKGDLWADTGALEEAVGDGAQPVVPFHHDRGFLGHIDEVNEVPGGEWVGIGHDEDEAFGKKCRRSNAR